MLTIRADTQRDYAVIDVETSMLRDGEIPRTKFWGYADASGYRDFKTTRALEKFLRQIKPKTLLHHSNFDVIQLLVDDVENIAIERSHHGRLIRCAMGKHTLQNTFTVFPVALKKIFAAFSYEKTELSNLKKRNYDDCVLGLECFLKLDAIFQDLVDVSPLRTGTVAGTTFKAAEKLAGKMPCDLRFLEAYRGGRVEVFDLRPTMATNYDIHSSYPFSFIECQPDETLLYCEVETRDWWCPFFHGKIDEMLLFPNGKFHTWIYKSNLERYVLPHAEKTRVRVLASFPIDCRWLVELQPLVRKLYDLKQSSPDAGIRECCKFLLNAFYGRIGLKGETERCRILTHAIDGDETECWKIGRKRWLCFDTVKRNTRSNFPFAAFITCNARARLHEGFVKNSALYGDTDSIFTSHRRFCGGVGPDLGLWGKKHRKRFCARNVKDYTYGDEEVLKGGTGERPQWTLKQFAQGGTARVLIRERRTGLRKRLVNADGTTSPITVDG